MLDIRFIRENADAVKTAMAHRKTDVDVDGVIALDDRRRVIVSESEALKAERNKISKSIGMMIKEGKDPACCEVCPREAVIYGKYDELLAEARQRQADNPGRYVEGIYGEHDGGGTQVLYLSHVPFEKLGLPELGDEAVPKLNRTIQHGVYQGMIAPAALYVVLGGVMLRNRRAGKKDKGGES